MSQIADALRDVRNAETEVADRLVDLGERHRADHDVFHLTHTLIRLHHANLDALSPFGERYGLGPGDDAEGEAAEPVAGNDQVLMRDLRHLHVAYAKASVNWVLLTQGAQVVRDDALLDTANRCHYQTLRGMKWTLTRLKTTAPHVLAG